KELEVLLKNKPWMILPLTENPTAPAQGALAVECRRTDFEIFEKLRLLHDPKTEREVDQERQVLAQWGGGCHQALGATAFHHPELGEVLLIKGRRPEGEAIQEFRWNRPEPDLPLPSPVKTWDGSRISANYTSLPPPP